MALPIETFFLSPNHQGTLQSQVQQMIAHGILSGRFGTGEKLPSTPSASRRTERVFARPGAPSIRTCPSVRSAINSRSTSTAWPTRTACEPHAQTAVATVA